MGLLASQRALYAATVARLEEKKPIGRWRDEDFPCQYVKRRSMAAYLPDGQPPGFRDGRQLYDLSGQSMSSTEISDFRLNLCYCGGIMSRPPTSPDRGAIE